MTRQRPSPGATLAKVEPIKAPAVRRFLAQEGVSFALAYVYLEQITARHAGRSLTGAAMKNVRGGYLVRGLTPTAQPFRIQAGPPGFSRVQGDGFNRVHVFAQAFDFLAYLALCDRVKPEGVAYVLHAPTAADAVAREIVSSQDPRHEGRLTVLWLGNTEKGGALTDRMLDALTEAGQPGVTMNHLYRNSPTLHDWHKTERPAPLRGPAVKQLYDTAWSMVQNRETEPRTYGPAYHLFKQPGD